MTFVTLPEQLYYTYDPKIVKIEFLGKQPGMQCSKYTLILRLHISTVYWNSLGYFDLCFELNPAHLYKSRNTIFHVMYI